MRGLILGCGLLAASAASAEVTTVAHNIIVSTPAVGRVATATPGEPIWTIEVTPVSSTTDQYIQIAHKVTLGSMMKGIVHVPASSRFAEMKGASEFTACTKIDSLIKYRSTPCLIDKDGDGKFDNFSFKFGEKIQDLGETVAYEKLTDKSSKATADTFKAVVIYVGSSGSSLLLSYREFSGGLARPAFTEELSIPLDKTYPQELRFKGLTIRVDKLNGTGLQYELLAAPPPSAQSRTAG
jgi:hypothetical protein